VVIRLKCTALLFPIGTSTVNSCLQLKRTNYINFMYGVVCKFSTTEHLLDRSPSEAPNRQENE